MPVSPSCSRSIGAVFISTPTAGYPEVIQSVTSSRLLRSARPVRCSRAGCRAAPAAGTTETYLSAVGGRNDERPFEPDESAVGQLRIIRRRECRRHGGRPAASGRGYPQSRGSGRKFDAVDLAEYRLRFRIGNLHVLRAVMVSALDRDFDPADGAPERCRDGQVRTADRMDRVGVRSRVLQEQLVGRTAGAGRLRILAQGEVHLLPCRLPCERFGCEDEPVGRSACEEEFVLSVRHAHRHPAVGGPSFAEERVEEEPVALPAEGIDRNVRGSFAPQRDARRLRIRTSVRRLRLRTGSADGCRQNERR